MLHGTKGVLKRNGNETIKRKHKMKTELVIKTEISERTCNLHDRDRETVNKVSSCV